MNCASAHVRDVSRQCREIIALAENSTDQKLWLLCHREVSPKLQGRRPRCGLSALSMAAELLQKQDNDGAICPMEETQELDNLLKMAQARGFSYQGEMYSAENLAKLAKEFYGFEYLVTRTAFEDTSNNFVISEVLKGNAVLIPYDADKNHEPCLENGHRAHWALITGILCELDGNSFDWTMCKQDDNMPMLFHASPSSKFILPQNGKFQNTYLCVKHGKSRHTAVWTLESLRHSNANLFELDSSKERQTGQYLIPEGGLCKELCGKVVVLFSKA